MLKAKGALAGKVWLVIDDTYAHKTGEKIEAVGFLAHPTSAYVVRCRA
jgi:hypothetical protein